MPRLQEAVSEARRSLTSDEAAHVVPSNRPRAAAVLEVPLRTRLAGIAQLCNAAREARTLASETHFIF